MLQLWKTSIFIVQHQLHSWTYLDHEYVWSCFEVQNERFWAEVCLVQYKSKETPQLIGLFSPNLVITNFMQCFFYGPIG